MENAAVASLPVTQDKAAVRALSGQNDFGWKVGLFRIEGPLQELLAVSFVLEAWRRLDRLC